MTSNNLELADSSTPLVPSAEDEFLKIERLGMEPVPNAERHGKASDLALVWTGAMANYNSLLTGALVIGTPIAIGLVGGQLGLLDSAIAIIIGAGLAAILHGLISMTGAKTGTSQMVFARAIFGHRGSYVGAALLWIMAVGWFAIDCVIAGWATVQLVGLLGIPATTSTALGAITLMLVLSVIVAIYGHQTVHIFEKYGALVFMLFCLVLFIVLFPQIHWNFSTNIHGLPRLVAIVGGASIIYALVASWIPFGSDYSRYLPRRTSNRSIAGWSGLGIGLSMILLGIFGVALATINPNNPDLLSVITRATPPWLTIPFLLFVILGEIWSNYFDVYTAGLAALAMDIPLKRWVSALICGIVGGIFVYGIALFAHIAQAKTYSDLVNNFLGFYVDFLLLTYLWVPAWAAVVLVDYFVFRRGQYAADQMTSGRGSLYWYNGGVFWRALLAWLIGFAATIPFIGSAILPWSGQTWQGPIAHLLGGMDLSGIIGAIISGLLYYILRRSLKQKPETVK